MAHYTPSQRRIVRRRSVRALRSVHGMTRAEARRTVYKPRSNSLVRDENTKVFLGIAIARRWGIPLLAEKDGAVV